jgi:glycosyltransferase involved in cell wall biosynthesis
MKVGVICRQHPKHFNGGLAIAAWNTARAAADAGVDVLFMTAERPDGFSGVELIDGVRVLWLKGAHHSDYYRWHPVISQVFATYHAAEKFDVVHCHGYSGAPIAIRGIDVPILFHDHGSKEGYAQSVLSDSVLRTHVTATPLNVAGFHDDVFFRPAQPAGESDFAHMRQYDRVLATSMISFMDFRTRYMLTNARLFYHCIYAVREVSSWIPERSSPPVVAVFAGNIDNPWKAGVYALARLISIRNQIKLLLIGEGPECAKFAKVNFPQQEYVPHCSERAALEHLRTADVLFEASTHHIGLNLTGISAIGLGVPVVTYPTSGHYDLIGENGEAGLVIDPCTDSVGMAIMKVIAEHDVKSRGARERFEKMFSPEVCSRRILELYKEVLDEFAGHRS